MEYIHYDTVQNEQCHIDIEDSSQITVKQLISVMFTVTVEQSLLNKVTSNSERQHRTLELPMPTIYLLDNVSALKPFSDHVQSIIR